MNVLHQKIRSLESRPGYQRTLLYLAATMLVAISLFLFVLSLAPTIISTDRARPMIESYVRDLSRLPIHIGDIHCGWYEGILIKGIKLSQNKGLSQDSILEIDKVSIKINLPKMIYGQLEFDFFTEGINIIFIRDQNGKTNFDELILESQDLKIEETPKKKKENKNHHAEETLSIPFDIRARVYFDEITISANDHLEDKHLDLHNGRIHLDIPSLVSKPLKLEVFAEPVLNSHRLPPVNVIFSAENMIEPEKTVSLRNTKLSVNGMIPGSKITASGSLNTDGIKSVCEIDFSALQKAIMPFLPPKLSNSEVTGNLKFIADAKLKTDHSAVFASSIEIENFGISGPVIADKMLSGINMMVINKGAFDLSGKSLEISDGEISFLAKSRFHYHGNLSEAKKGRRKVSFSIDSALIHLGEIFSQGRIFLKENPSLYFGTGDDAPVLKAAGIGISGDLSSGLCIVKVDQLNLRIPFVKFKSSENEVSLRGIHFSFFDSTSELINFYPEKLNLFSSFSIDEASMTGKNSIFLENLEMLALKFNARNIQKNEKSLLGIVTEITVEQALGIKKLYTPTLGEVKNFRQSFETSCFLLPEKKVEIKSTDLRFGTPDLTVKNEQLGTFQTKADIATSVSGIEISRLDPLEINLNGMHTSLAFGSIISLDFDADMKSSKVKHIDSTGRFSMDLQQLFESISNKPDFFQKLLGSVEANWRFAGHLPETSEMTKLKQLPITDLKKDLDFIDTVDINIALRNVNANFSIHDEKNVQIGNLSADPLFQYVYHGRSGNGEFKGKIRVGNVDGIPHMEIENAFSSEFLYSGTHDGMKMVTFSQSLESVSPEIKESLNLLFSGIDHAVLQNTDKDPSMFLKKCGGTLSAKISIKDTSAINRMLKNFEIDGSLSAGLDLWLIPEKRVGGKSWIDITDMGISQRKFFFINDLEGKLIFEKEYLIGGEDHIAMASTDLAKETFLSNRVIKTDYVGNPERKLEDHDVSRYQPPVTNQFDPERTIGFDSAHSERGPVPVDIEKFRAGIELNHGLPEIKCFQTEILGGSVLGSVSVRKKNNAFSIPIVFSFSGIQTSKLFKGPLDKKLDEDTEMSGQFFVLLPVSTELSDFMNEIQIDILFTSIGSKALEQMLYALDPYENNEKIVSQRKFLKKGYPRWIRFVIKDGNLSLEGVLSVQGVDVEIPSLDRLNISGLSGFEPLEEVLRKLEPAVQFFKIASANRIISKQGSHSLEFIRE